MAAVLSPLGLAVHLAQVQAARHLVVHLAVHSMQAQQAQDHLADYHQLQDHLVALELVDLLVNQVVLVSMMLGPLITMHHQHSPSVQVEVVLAPHHLTSVLLVQPEALVPPP